MELVKWNLPKLQIRLVGALSYKSSLQSIYYQIIELKRI